MWKFPIKNLAYEEMVKNQRVIFEQNIKLIWSKTKVSEILESCKQATMYILSQFTFCHVHTRATNNNFNSTVMLGQFDK